MDEKVIQEQFMRGYDCSQVVLSHFAEKLGLTKDEANRVSACFGGGMMQADACGAFTGALMAIGLKYGHYDAENLMAQKGVMMEKCGEFKAKFAEILKDLTAGGVTVLMVSHDVEFCAKTADEVSMFFDGGITTTNTPNRFFSQNSFYTTAANRMSRHIFKNAVNNEDVIELCKKNLTITN